MKLYGIWTSNPYSGVQDRFKKISFLSSGPGVISYRLSHKRARSVNPMESSSVYGQTDGQMDRQSADNSVFFQNLKIR
jgi:hypothetical protein